MDSPTREFKCCQPVANAVLSHREFTDHLVTVHHAVLRNDMAGVKTQMQREIQQRKSPCGTLTELCSLFRVLSDRLIHYLHQNESVVFPGLAQLDQSSRAPIEEHVRQAILRAYDEHNFIQEALARMRWLTEEYAACTIAGHKVATLLARLAVFDADLSWHIVAEQNLLLPCVRPRQERLAIVR